MAAASSCTPTEWTLPRRPWRGRPGVRARTTEIVPRRRQRGRPGMPCRSYKRSRGSVSFQVREKTRRSFSKPSRVASTKNSVSLDRSAVCVSTRTSQSSRRNRMVPSRSKEGLPRLQKAGVVAVRCRCRTADNPVAAWIPLKSKAFGSYGPLPHAATPNAHRATCQTHKNQRMEAQPQGTRNPGG